MECAGNTLVVHVVSVRGLTIKGTKPVDVYCSLSTSGKGPWKSKVSTNAIRAEPSTGLELRWDERCEFQLNDADTKLVLHINHKTIFGTTETLGELVFQLEQMPRLQSPTWYRLGKPGSADKERGQIQLGFQFSNTLGHQGVTSISNLSLNKIEKENKLHRLRRKMQEFGRKATGGGDGSTADTQSLASISIAAGHHHHHQNLTISRRSSFSSTNSGALAFSSPSPNPPTLEEDVDDGRRSLTLIGGEDIGHCNLMSSTQLATTTKTSETIGHSARRGGRASNWANAGTNNQQNASALFISTSSETPSSSFDTGSSHHQKQPSSVGQQPPPHPRQQSGDLLRPPSSSAQQQHQQHGGEGFDDGNNSLGGRSSVSGRSAFSVFSSAMMARDGMEKTHEQHQKTPPPPSSQQKLRVKMRQKAEQFLQLRALTGGGNSSAKKQMAEQQQQHEMERRDSIASSSGFVSFGSGQLGALNEQTSPEHLLNVIRHLRRELLKKEERIRDLEEYTDHLVTKVMVTNPELLAAPSPNKPGERRQKIHQRH